MPRDSPEALRRVLLPLELAEAELRTKPAASVIVLVRDVGRGLEILLGTRARREGDPWSGQVGLPGGRHRDEDGTILETALRETKEEMGLDLTGRAEVLGHMAPRAPGNRLEMLVVPYVAFTRERLEPQTGPEISEAFWCALAELPPTRATARVMTILGELTVPAFRFGGRVIWGFTYRLLEELLVLVGLSA
ncbi:MAG: NUDIX hydrolase [Methanobacteriota archaeon]